MKNPPSLTVCRQLHKLAPGWTDTDEVWVYVEFAKKWNLLDLKAAVASGVKQSEVVPCPDTDYLLEKLPHTLAGKNLRLEHIRSADAWEVGYPRIGVWQHEENLAEALIRLACVLIEKGRLTP